MYFIYMTSLAVICIGLDRYETLKLSVKVHAIIISHTHTHQKKHLNN